MMNLMDSHMWYSDDETGRINTHTVT